MYYFLILRSKNLKTKKLRNIDSKIQQKPLPHGRGFFSWASDTTHHA